MQVMGCCITIIWLLLSSHMWVRIFAPYQVVGVILECAVTRLLHTIIWPLLRLEGTVKGRHITIVWCCSDYMYR